MSNPTYGSFFSGGGIADISAKAAGFELVFANEYDPKIAAVYAANLGDHIRVADIRDEDVRDYPRVNHFHASPVCTRASIANKNRGESQIDIDTARKVSEYIEFHKPDTVTIENVSQYRDFKSYKGIIQTLDACGYWHNASILNSADFGVPQTRRRLIVRAVRGGFVPPLPTPVKPWVGWYAAVEDLIDTFESSEFAKWQLKRLLKIPEIRTLLLSQGGYDNTLTVASIDEPANTVTSNTNQLSLRAYILEGKNANQEWGKLYRDKIEPMTTITGDHYPRAFIVPSSNASSFDVRADDIPARTVGDTERVGNAPRAFLVDGQPSVNDYGCGLNIKQNDQPSPTIAGSQYNRPARAWLSLGRVVKISPRGLARFQSIPDWYELPDNKALACKIIGNGWPSLMAQRVFESLRQ